MTSCSAARHHVFGKALLQSSLDGEEVRLRDQRRDRLARVFGVGDGLFVARDSAAARADRRRPQRSGLPAHEDPAAFQPGVVAAHLARRRARAKLTCGYSFDSASLDVLRGSLHSGRGHEQSRGCSRMASAISASSRGSANAAANQPSRPGWFDRRRPSRSGTTRSGSACGIVLGGRRRRLERARAASVPSSRRSDELAVSAHGSVQLQDQVVRGRRRPAE